jgi:quinol monooxygenase YgiN
MEEHVSWIIELAVKDGALDTYRELMEEMVSGTSAEPQTLAYEWYISADGGTVHIFEKYATSESMVSHVNGFLEKWAGRFMDSVDVARFVVYGDPSPEARALLEGFGPVYLGPWGGFSRFAES